MSQTIVGVISLLLGVSGLIFRKKVAHWWIPIYRDFHLNMSKQYLEVTVLVSSIFLILIGFMLILDI